jgi:hypothetical protein
MKTKRSLFLVPALLFASISVAQAKPSRGSYELRLGQAFLPGIAFTGAHLYLPSESSGDIAPGDDSLRMFGVGAGLGYFFADNWELGASFNFLHISAGDDDFNSPGISPFVRYYSWLSEKAAFFLEGTLLLQPIFEGNDTGTIWGGGIEAGFERFITDSWAVRVAATYKYLRLNGIDQGLHVPGLNWGIAAYF